MIEKILSNPVLMIFTGILAIALISTLCYYAVRFMKGKLKLELQQRSISSGQQVTGTLSVNVKKQLHADRLYVALIGEREIRRHKSSTGNSNRPNNTLKEWHEFYRDEVDIILDEQLHSGFNKRYDIAIAAPSQDNVRTDGHAISKVAENMQDGITKNIAAGIGSIVGAAGTMMGGRKRWKVISRLETKGVDLATSKRIHVSLKCL